MAFNKIGFHFGSEATATGWGPYVRALDAAGVPAVLMSMAGEGFGDIYGCWENGSTVPHVACIRYGGVQGNHDVPPYGTNQRQAAVDWWNWYKPRIGDDARKYRDRIVLKMGNELDKLWAEWLAGFYLELYDILQNDDEGPWRMAAFNYSAGEPEPAHWRGPTVQEYLRLCAADRVHAAVGLHEYSLADILNRGDLSHIGRFTDLFLACDEAGIARPDVYIHEFGWRQEWVPGVNTAMSQIPWAAELYASYPEVKGAGLWTLQGSGNYGDINTLVQPLIAPMTQYSLTARFPDPTEPPTPPDGGDMECKPRVPYAREYYVVPQDATMARYLEIAQQAFAGRKTLAFSYDDAGHAPGVSSNTAVLYDIPADKEQAFIDWYAEHYPETAVIFAGSTPKPPTAGIDLVYRPCKTEFITQVFGANPQNYADAGLPGHDGLDYGVVKDAPFYAAAPGTVVHASDRRWSFDTASNYGWHVVIQHDGGWATVYAHARPDLPVKVGDVVQAGQIVGYSGNTGFSSGYHLHFGILDQTGTVDPDNGYPTTWKYGRPVDPWPWVEGKDAPPTVTPPPATGPARIGLHASADPGELYGGTAEFEEFATLFPGVIKVLNAHSETAVKRLATNSPGAEWIMRAFLSWGGRSVTSQNFFDWTKDDTLRTVNALRSLGIGDEHIHVELHNEPNLALEGWGYSWTDGVGFNAWLLDVLQLYRNFLPTVKFLYPGLSPGGSIAGVRYDSAAFLNQSLAAAKACDGVGVHAYWSDLYPIAQAYAHVDAYAQIFGSKPLWITEASRNDRPATKTPQQYANEYFAFWQELKKRPSVQGVTFYVASGSDPYFQPECWVVNGQSLGIAAAIKALKG